MTGWRLACSIRRISGTESYPPKKALAQENLPDDEVAGQGRVAIRKASPSRQFAHIESHPDSGIHFDAGEGANFLAAANAARSGDGSASCAAQGPEPSEICAAHRAFGIPVGAQKFRGVLFEFRHYFIRPH